MNIETNSKSKKYQFSLSSMVLKSNLVNLNVNKISPSFKNTEKNKRILLLKNQNKNINKKEFNTNDDKDDKSTSNLTSIEKTNESNLINNHTKQQSHLNSSRNIANSSIKKNLLNNCINNYSNNSNYEALSIDNLFEKEKKGLKNSILNNKKRNEKFFGSNKLNDKNKNDNFLNKSFSMFNLSKKYYNEEIDKLKHKK